MIGIKKDDILEKLEDEIKDLKDELKATKNGDELQDKAAYWQRKAKEEAVEIERLQRKILAYGDKKLISDALKTRD